MDQSIENVLNLPSRHQASFYVALAQQAQPLLVSSKYYYYATRTMSLCWSWIERRDVPGMTLYDLFHDDDDHGVETAMYAEQDPVRWNAWGCMALALANVGFHAFEAEGTPPPETFENAFPDEILAEFLGYYQGALGESQVPELLAAFLETASDEQLTESIVRSKFPMNNDHEYVCDVCRDGWNLGRTKKMIYVDVDQKLIWHRCMQCGSYWFETERYAKRVPYSEVPDAVKEAGR